MPAKHDELAEFFGNLIKAERKRLGLSQMALAAKAGMHLNALGNLERGQRSPSLHTILRLSNALDVKASSLVAKVDKHRWALV